MNQRPASATFAAIATIAVVLAAGCAAPVLTPAPQAELVPGRKLAAVARHDGVRVVVQPGAWSGYPSNLSGELTPLRLTIENGSGQPLRIRYEDFVVETGRGARYTPLPPLKIEGAVVERSATAVETLPDPIRPRFAHSGFFLTPWYGPHYSGMPIWARPWAFNPYYYRAVYPEWWVTLPTQDMLEQAIPEGVIDAGGMVSGFLYFPILAAEVDRVTFTARLVQGSNGDELAVLQVPFLARH